MSKLEKKLKLWNRFLEQEGHEFIGGVLEVWKPTGGRLMGLIQWIHTEEEHLIFTVSIRLPYILDTFTKLERK